MRATRPPNARGAHERHPPPTEADLDATHQRRLEHLPRCCGGCDSNQGRRACTCGAAALDDDDDDDDDMWALERQSPWLLALYAAVLVATIAASALWPLGFAP